MVLSGLLVATAAAFGLTEKLKLVRSPITGTRVSKLFSPVCNCLTGHASIGFRLRRRGDVEVDVVTRRDAVVRRLAREALGPGFVSFRWNGLGGDGRVSPDGAYQIRVRLFTARRTILLPNVIRLITVPPTIQSFSITRNAVRVGERLRIAYRFGESAHPILFVDGRRAVYGRFARAAGTVDWFGRVGGQTVHTGIHSLALAARDDAGNTSPRTNALSVRIGPAKPVGKPHPRRHHGRKTL